MTSIPIQHIPAGKRTPRPKHDAVLPRRPQIGKKPKGVTLAKFEAWDRDDKCVVKDRDAERAAAETMSKRATPERLAKAEIKTFNKMHPGDRVTEAPLDVLHVRGTLSKDKHRNHLLYVVGNALREHWNNAGLTGIGAMDMGRVGSGEGNAAWMMPTSEFAALHRSQVRDAIGALGPYFSKYVVAIVCEEMSTEDAGRKFADRMDRTTAIAIAVEILRAGLTLLAMHWGHIRRA